MHTLILFDFRILKTVRHITGETDSLEFEDDLVETREEKNKGSDRDRRRRSSSSTDKSRRRGRYRPGIMLNLPSHVNKVHSSVKRVDSQYVCLKHSKLMAKLEDLTGEVEKILSDHLAVISFPYPGSSMDRRALCTWQEVFMIDWTKEQSFSKPGELFELTPYHQNLSLREVLKVGMKVKIDVIPLIPLEPCLSGICYSVIGLIFGENLDANQVPLKFDTNLQFIIQEFKSYFGEVVLALDQNLNLLPKQCLSLPTEKYGNQTKKGHKRRLDVKDKYKTKNLLPLPSPASITSNSSVPERLNAQIGIVINIVNENYGVGCTSVNFGGSRSHSVQVLFDRLDFVKHDMNMSFSDMSCGNYMKFNCIKVPGAMDGERKLIYLATAIAVAPNLAELNHFDFSSVLPLPAK